VERVLEFEIEIQIGWEREGERGLWRSQEVELER